MNDIDHWFSGDVSTNSGDLNVVDTVTMTRQRILRRILTNPATQDAPADYIWNPDYGCGAAGYVGETVNKLNELSGKIASQLLLEPGVASTPAPTATVTALGKETLQIVINYVDTSTGQPQVYSFTTGGAQ